MNKKLPDDSSVEVTYELHQSDNVGTPAKCTISEVYYKGVDITDFVMDNCDSILVKWEEDIERGEK